MEKWITINGITIRCQVSDESENQNGCEFLTRGDCPKCTCTECEHGLIVRKDADGMLYSKPCRCRDHAIVRRRLRNAGMLQLSERCTLKSFVAETNWQLAMLQTAQSYVQERVWRAGKGLFLSGQSGAGKSHLAVAVASEAAAAGAKPQWFRWNSEGYRLKSLASDPQGYQNMLRPFLISDLLLLDDLWKAQPTQADLRLAFEILDTRVANGRATILTSERSLAEISSLLDGAGEAVSGRIFESCSPYILEVAKDASRNYRFNRQ